MIGRESVTGLVLAGGRGSRMGGVDKGLQPYQGSTLVGHALSRLAPQVGAMTVNANRNVEAYAALGVPVWPDAAPDFAGPLAGFLAGLGHCTTPYLVTVPCDSPLFPNDLVERLALALARDDAQIAIAATIEDGVRRRHPVFCLMQAQLRDSLQRYIDAGDRKVDRWTALHRCVEVEFDDARAFFNVNTAAELQQLHPNGEAVDVLPFDGLV